MSPRGIFGARRAGVRPLSRINRAARCRCPAYGSSNDNITESSASRSPANAHPTIPGRCRSPRSPHPPPHDSAARSPRTSTPPPPARPPTEPAHPPRTSPPPAPAAQRPVRHAESWTPACRRPRPDATPRTESTPTRVAPASPTSARPRARASHPELPYQQPPGPIRLVGGHLLLQHRRDQRLQHQPGPRQPQPRPPMPSNRQQPMPGHERVRIIRGAQHLRQPFQQPLRPGPRPPRAPHTRARTPAGSPARPA